MGISPIVVNALNENHVLRLGSMGRRLDDLATSRGVMGVFQ